MTLTGALIVAFVITALVLAILEAVNVPSPKVKLGWAAMAFFFASVMLAHFAK